MALPSSLGDPYCHNTTTPTIDERRRAASLARVEYSRCDAPRVEPRTVPVLGTARSAAPSSKPSAASAALRSRRARSSAASVAHRWPPPPPRRPPAAQIGRAHVWTPVTL